MRTTNRPGLLAAAVVTAVLLGIPIAAAATRDPFGIEGRSMPGDTEKAALVDAFRREYEAALAATPGPVRGRPVEGWRPEIVEGVIESAGSPFEGDPFVLSNVCLVRSSS